MKKNQLFSSNVINEENSTQWNRDFFNSYEKGNKQEILKLLKQADKLYLDEFFIYNSISKLNSKDNSAKNDESILNGLKKCHIVKDIVKENNAISIKTANVPIKVYKLSNILSEVKLDKHSKDELVRKSQYSAEYISQILGFKNRIVTGYVYGIADKAKSLHTWVEFTNNNNQEFVIDYDSNTVLNKEGYYFIRHAEPIKKVNSDDIKGKTSVGKFISYDSINSNTESEIEVEFDDIDFDR